MKLIKNCHIWWWAIIQNSKNPARKIISCLCLENGACYNLSTSHISCFTIFFLHFKWKIWVVLKRFGNFGEFSELRTEPQLRLGMSLGLPQVLASIPVGILVGNVICRSRSPVYTDLWGSGFVFWGGGYSPWVPAIYPLISTFTTEFSCSIKYTLLSSYTSMLKYTLLSECVSMGMEFQPNTD